MKYAPADTRFTKPYVGAEVTCEPCDTLVGEYVG